MKKAAARGRIDEARQVIARDPAAFLEILNQAPFPAWRMSGAGKLEWANGAYLEALESKSLDQAIARNLLLDQAAADQARRTIDGDAPIEELRHVVIGSQRRAMKIMMFPLSGGAGGMAFDVTEAEDARDCAGQAHARARPDAQSHERRRGDLRARQAHDLPQSRLCDDVGP
ncbi:MAG: hypothetical protein WDN76_07300 [Alphaproteobacteria bacterium]